MEHIEAVEVARGISDLGVMIMICAFFLVLTGMMWVFVFKWFKHLVEGIVVRHENAINNLLTETKAQNEVLSDISAGLQPMSQMQINSVCNNFFDLDCERLCRLVKNIRKENNIDDKENTRKKIERRCGALFKKRSVEFSNFMHRGKRLSEYMSDVWTQKMADIVEGEIYNNNGANNERAYANIKTGVDEMKVEFFNMING